MKWRLVQLETHDAFTNMSIDEAVSEFVASEKSPPTVRLYKWSPSAVSIGYFQSLKDEVDDVLCKKLGIDPLPVLAFYRDGEEDIVESLEKYDGKSRFIRFSDSEKFPEHYVNIIMELYPDVNADVPSASEMWKASKVAEQHIDPRVWLKQEGFIKGRKMQDAGTLESDHTNYKSMYYDLKEKYDKLLQELEELRTLLGE